MAAIDFPNSPTVGDLFTVGNITYEWTGTVWKSVTVLQTLPHASTHGGAGSDAVTIAASQVAGLTATAAELNILDGATVTTTELNTLDGITASTSALNTIDDGTAGLTALSNGTAGLTYQPVSHNYIINGAFDFWQRGTSFSGVSSSSRSADQWFVVFNGSGNTVSMTRQTMTPQDISAVGFGTGQFFLRLSQTGTVTGQTRISLDQKIEDVRTLAGETVTLSFWAKASKAIEVVNTNLFQSFGSGGSSGVSNVYSPNIPITTSWQRITIPISVASVAGKTIGANSFLELVLELTVNDAYDFDIWGVQLEAGSVATPFKRHAPSLQGELAACRRFARRYDAQGNPFARYGLGIVDSAADVQVPFLEWAEMRTYPTQVITSGTADFFVETAGGGYAVSTIALSNGNSLRFRATGAPANGVALVRGNNAASAFFVVSSEL
jgi:hypothetical protein